MKEHQFSISGLSHRLVRCGDDVESDRVAVEYGELSLRFERRVAEKSIAKFPLGGTGASRSGKGPEIGSGKVAALAGRTFHLFEKPGIEVIPSGGRDRCRIPAVLPYRWKSCGWGPNCG